MGFTTKDFQTHLNNRRFDLHLSVMGLGALIDHPPTWSGFSQALHNPLLQMSAPAAG